MDDRKFLDATDVAALLNISESKAYKIMAKLNKELEDSGKIIVHGRISKRYLLERIYC